MKYAIIEISGKQFWVEMGKFYDFNRIPTELGKEITLNRVLLLNNEGGLRALRSGLRGFVNRNPLPLLPVQKYIPLNSGSPHPETLTRPDNPNIGIGTYGPALPSRGPTPSICSCALNIFIAHFNNRPSANRCVCCSADLLDNSRNL